MLDDPETEYSEDEQKILERIAAGQPSGLRSDAGLLAEVTRGERLADRVAAIGGSWGFIIAFGIVLIAWVLINSALPKMLGLRFDPYPFIFLNLLLSMLAAIQAPIIMMSQNRQSTKDRLSARLDFETNVRAQLDIERLHFKLDALLEDRFGLLDARIEALSNKVRDEPR